MIELSIPQNCEQWDEPILFDSLETPEISSCFLPQIVGDFARALAITTETAEAMSIMVILGVISTALAKRFTVSPKEGWYEPVNIYTLIALPPGNNKSFVLKACTEPLVAWEKEQAVLLEPEIKRQHSEYKTREKILEGLRCRVAKSKDYQEQQRLIRDIAEQEDKLQDPPVLPTLFVNDTTAESLSRFVYEQKGRFAIFSDEGGVIETLAGLYSHGVANIDILLKGIDGGEVRVCRKDRHFHLNPYLTIVLAVQPAVIRTLCERQAYAGNGALERFLYVIPKSKLGYRTHDNPSVPSIIQHAYHERIKALLNISPQMIQEKVTPFVLTLSPEAKEDWQDFQGKIELQLRPEGKLAICQGWGAKICGFALRIAGLLHVVEHEQSSFVINKNTMTNALLISTLLIEHSLSAHGLMGSDQVLQDAKEVFHWLVTQRQPSFTKTELSYGMRNKKCAKSERLTKALSVLRERNIISSPIKRMTRRPTTTYFVNPQLFNGAPT